MFIGARRFEIFSVLGIEATRQSIYNEIREVMSGGGETYINYHHLGLLADRMTLNRNLVPIFRTGILADDVGPIMKATFEVQTDVFLQAARHGELDNMRGVSANVMTGQTGFYGTHAFQLLVDLEKMKTFEEPPQVEEKKKDLQKEEMFHRGKSECMVDFEERPILQKEHLVMPAVCLETDYDMQF